MYAVVSGNFFFLFDNDFLKIDALEYHKHQID